MRNAELKISGIILSLRCGCPVDTSAKQKHRPSRQARPPIGARQSVFSFKGITDSFTLRVQNDKKL